jgi:hypothetical protein
LTIYRHCTCDQSDGPTCQGFDKKCPAPAAQLWLSYRRPHRFSTASVLVLWSVRAEGADFLFVRGIIRDRTSLQQHHTCTPLFNHVSGALGSEPVHQTKNPHSAHGAIDTNRMLEQRMEVGFVPVVGCEELCSPLPAQTGTAFAPASASIGTVDWCAICRYYKRHNGK